MFCKKCGKKLEDGAAFCPDCGAPVESGDVLQSALDTRSPVSGGPADNVRGVRKAASGRRKGWALPAAVGGAAVACILAVVLLSGFFSGAKGDLTKAIAKSADAWQAASDSLELTDLAALQKEQKVRQKATVQLKSVSDVLGEEAKLLEGMSVTMEAGSDLAGRQMDFALMAAYGPVELISAGLWGSDSVLSLTCPALLGEQSYGLDTETLGHDLTRLNPDRADEVKDISFNIFDIASTYAGSGETGVSAYAALNDAMEVEKTGVSTQDINGVSLRCSSYRVTIPQEAMLDCLDEVRSAHDTRKRNAATLDLFRALGASEEELDAMEEQLGSADPFEDLEEALREAGDLELDVYVNDGYISSVRWEGEGESLVASFGGGENYADDFWLDVRTADGHFGLTSSGNHSAADGAFTDTSNVIIESGYTVLNIESQLTYDPRQPSDNFSWTLSTDGVSLEAKGQLTNGKDSLFLDLDQLSVNMLGIEYARLGLTWSVGPYTAQPAPKDVVMLSDMTEDSLTALSDELSVNLQNWLIRLMNDAPELF